MIHKNVQLIYNDKKPMDYYTYKDHCTIKVHETHVCGKNLA